MSQLGTPYSPPPPYAPPSVPPPSPPTSDDIPGWMVLLAALLAFGLAGLLAFVVVNGRDDGTAAPPPRHARVFPDHWNHRIAPLARVAAKERGLSFEHPVAVRFLKPAAFRRTLTKENGKTTPRDRRQLQRAEGELRALGLLRGHVDLAHAAKSAAGAAVLAYYSFRTKSITVRGRQLTPSIKATLVHELTHVLQDQNFRIGHRLKKLQQAKGRDTGAYDVLDAIVEGDAQRVEQLYRASLSPARRGALDAGQRREQAGAQPGLSRVPSIMVALMSAPYELGLAMTEAVAARGGNTAVDHILRTAPTHDVTLLDPVRALTGATGAVRVPALSPTRGEKKLQSGEFGAVSLYLTLASRIPQQQALTAADGWGGDSYLAYGRGRTTCMRMRFAGRTSADTGRIRSSLQAWSAAGPGGSSVRLVGGRVQLQSCDPGAQARFGTGNATGALTYAAVRNQYIVSLSRAHVPPAAAHCITTHLFDSYPFSELSDPTFGSHDTSVQARVHEIAMGCR